MHRVRIAFRFVIVTLGAASATLGALTFVFGLIVDAERAAWIGAILLVLGLATGVVGLRLREFPGGMFSVVPLKWQKASRKTLEPIGARALDLAKTKRSVTLWHLLWALTETEEILRILSTFNVAPRALTSVCQHECSKLPARRWWRFDGGADAEVKASLQRVVTHAISSEQPTVKPENVFLDFVSPETPEEIRETLLDSGFDRLALRAFIAHGKREPPGVFVPDQGPVDVLLINDEFTTRDFVQKTLVNNFGLLDSNAERLMLEVHELGQASLGMMDASEAREKIGQTLSEAHQMDFPLRFVVTGALTDAGTDTDTGTVADSDTDTDTSTDADTDTGTDTDAVTVTVTATAPVLEE